MVEHGFYYLIWSAELDSNQQPFDYSKSKTLSHWDYQRIISNPDIWAFKRGFRGVVKFRQFDGFYVGFLRLELPTKLPLDTRY